jgi:hypothetical protein
MSQQMNPSLLEEGMAGVGIGANILLSPLTRLWYAGWGATQAERRQPLPGDDLVSAPKLETTRAITIKAPPESIWPWLAQIGQGRAGLYSYQKLENMVGCQIENMAEICPELQDLAIGDKIRLGPDGFPYYVVGAIDPGRTLTLTNPPEDEMMASTWVFHLVAIEPNRTRLLARNRLAYEPTVMNLIIWRVITDPTFFVMERRMLIGIKDRVEAQ